MNQFLLERYFYRQRRSRKKISIKYCPFWFLPSTHHFPTTSPTSMFETFTFMIWNQRSSQNRMECTNIRQKEMEILGKAFAMPWNNNDGGWFWVRRWLQILLKATVSIRLMDCETSLSLSGNCLYLQSLYGVDNNGAHFTAILKMWFPMPLWYFVRSCPSRKVRIHKYWQDTEAWSIFTYIWVC